SERRRHRRAGHPRQLIADVELSEVSKLGLVESLALERDQTHRKTRGIELLYDWRQSAGRQAPQIRHRQVGNLIHIRIGAGPGLEEDLDDADPGQRPRLHMIDARAEGEKPLEPA